MLEVTATGDFTKTLTYLSKLGQADFYKTLDSAGARGVAALRAATPVESGRTAASWSYEVDKNPGGARISWLNSHTENGVPIAVILQYGHGTGTGGYVQGRDYINPALRGIFDQIADDVWKAVQAL